MHTLVVNKSDEFEILSLFNMYVLSVLCEFVYTSRLLNLLPILHVLQYGNLYVNDLLYNLRLNMYYICYNAKHTGLIILHYHYLTKNDFINY